MRILIYGAGVIGSLYAVLFAQAGHDVSVFARGRRLTELTEKGLLYSGKTGVKKAEVSVIDRLANDDRYDYIFLTVRSEQAAAALHELKSNISETIVTMINTSEGYTQWESCVGKGRILPAFPGAGGSIDDGVLNAGLTPAAIQPTTFGEIDGVLRQRTKTLKRIFRRSGVRVQIVGNMHHWQISHLGLVVPIADAYYMAAQPQYAYRQPEVMRLTAVRLKDNFNKLAERKQLTPLRLHILRVCPVFILQAGLKLVFKSRFGDVFMYRHAMKSPEEMRRLHDEFYHLVGAPCEK